MYFDLHQQRQVKAEPFIIYRAFTFFIIYSCGQFTNSHFGLQWFLSAVLFPGWTGYTVCVFNNLKKKQELGIIFYFELSPKGSWLHVKFADVYFGAGPCFSVSTLSVHVDVKLTSLWMLLVAAVSSS